MAPAVALLATVTIDCASRTAAPPPISKSASRTDSPRPCLVGSVEHGTPEALAHVDRGAALADRGEPDLALVEFDRALALTPSSVCALYDRGIVEMKLGRYRAAIADFSKAIEVSPRATDLYWNRGTAKDELSLWQEAVEDYDRALALDPRHANVLVNKGNSLRSLGRLGEALNCYDLALAVHPNHRLATNGRRDLLDAAPALAERSPTGASCLPPRTTPAG